MYVQIQIWMSIFDFMLQTHLNVYTVIKIWKKCIQRKENLHFVPHLWDVLAWVPYVMLLCLYNRHGDTGWYWGHRVVGLGNLPYWNQPLSWSKSWKILDCKLPFFKYQSTVHDFWKVINTSDKHVTPTITFIWVNMSISNSGSL